MSWKVRSLKAEPLRSEGKVLYWIVILTAFRPDGFGDLEERSVGTYWNATRFTFKAAISLLILLCGFLRVLDGEVPEGYFVVPQVPDV